MECGLQWKDITCWDEVPRLTLTHEEMLEAAIPDYCPDMGRVVEASGTLCLRSITARSGNLELKGTVRVTVLYTSEESVGLRSLTQAVPFVCTSENRPLAACQAAAVRGPGTDAPPFVPASDAGVDGLRLYLHHRTAVLRRGGGPRPAAAPPGA
mgnify:CR=1 FL=1